MIRGFVVQRHNDGSTTARWAESAAPLTIYRSRVAIRIPPAPWGLVEGDTLSLLLPKLSGNGETTKTITFTGVLPTTPQELVDYVNALQIGNVEARLDTGNGVSIHVMATLPFIQVLARGTSTVAKFSLHTELVSPMSHWEPLAVIDSGIASFHDVYGQSSDCYRAEDSVDGLTTPPATPIPACSLSTVEGFIKDMDGTPRRLLRVAAHMLPPSEPDVVNDIPLPPPGWPVNVLRPVDVLPVFGADTTGANPSKMWHSVVTDENGFFSIPATRGQRVWLEIKEVGWSGILDVPDAPYVDIATLSSWRRTGMLGPLDR